MNNAIWRLDSDYLAAYTEDAEIMARIRRYYPDVEPVAWYYRAGKRIAVQYRVPNRRKRSMRRMLGVDVARESSETCTQTGAFGGLEARGYIPLTDYRVPSESKRK